MSTIKKSRGRGRPPHVYQLTDEANGLFPTTYANFAVGLMHEVAKFNGPGFINKVFRGRMKSQLQTYQQRLQGKTLSERVKELARIRDEEGYMARFDENENDYVLTEHNCPIALIAQEYPHVCEIETALFRQSLDAKVVRVGTSYARGAISVAIGFLKPTKSSIQRDREVRLSRMYIKCLMKREDGAFLRRP